MQTAALRTQCSSSVRVQPRSLQTRLVLLTLAAVLLPLQHLLLADEELLPDHLLPHWPLVSCAVSQQLNAATHIMPHMIPTNI